MSINNSIPNSFCKFKQIIETVDDFNNSVINLFDISDNTCDMNESNSDDNLDENNYGCQQ